MWKQADWDNEDVPTALFCVLFMVYNFRNGPQNGDYVYDSDCVYV